MNQLTVVSQTNKPFQYYAFFSNNFNLTQLNSLDFNPSGVSPFLTSVSYITGDQNSPYLIVQIWEYENSSNLPNSWAIFDITGKLVKTSSKNFSITWNSPNVVIVLSKSWMQRFWWIILILCIIIFLAIIGMLFLILFKPKIKIFTN